MSAASSQPNSMPFVWIGRRRPKVSHETEPSRVGKWNLAAMMRAISPDTTKNSDPTISRPKALRSS